MLLLNCSSFNVKNSTYISKFWLKSPIFSVIWHTRVGTNYFVTVVEQSINQIAFKCHAIYKKNIFLLVRDCFIDWKKSILPHLSSLICLRLILWEKIQVWNLSITLSNFGRLEKNYTTNQLSKISVLHCNCTYFRVFSSVNHQNIFDGYNFDKFF